MHRMCKYSEFVCDLMFKRYNQSIRDRHALWLNFDLWMPKTRAAPARRHLPLFFSPKAEGALTKWRELLLLWVCRCLSFLWLFHFSVPLRWQPLTVRGFSGREGGSRHFQKEEASSRAQPFIIRAPVNGFERQSICLFLLPVVWGVGIRGGSFSLGPPHTMHFPKLFIKGTVCAFCHQEALGWNDKHKRCWQKSVCSDWDRKPHRCFHFPEVWFT